MEVWATQGDVAKPPGLEGLNLYNPAIHNSNQENDRLRVLIGSSCLDLGNPEVGCPLIPTALSVKRKPHG
jgi:hypothetical protein